MSYVDAGYSIALATLFVYAVTLVLRRRRWERALHMSEPAVELLAVFALLAVALIFLLVEGLGSSLDYFDTVGQAMAHRQTLGTQTFRLEGTVVPNSIQATDTGSNFTICQGSDVVHVANAGSPPQLFGSRVPVVVVGHFTTKTSLDFDATQILVKHTASYIAKYPKRVKAPNGTTR